VGVAYDRGNVGAGFKPAPANPGAINARRGYYEHVIRNEEALDRIRAYIANNPARWAMIRRISRGRRLPRAGGFETRPYKPHGHGPGRG